MAKSRGHSEHSRPADQQRGLPGKLGRPIKIAMLGAGSGFTPALMNDVLLIPGADRGEIALVDIDPARLETMYRLIGKLVAQLGKTGWKVTASTRRREVLRGSDYIVNCIEVSGVDCVRYDNDIPLKYGLDQCIGDTIGPGGLFKALRTIPVWLDLLRDAEELCPDALVLNYTNPMSMLCLAAGRTSRMQIVGLCHSVQGCSHILAARAGVPIAEMEWECAGINHMAWFTKLAQGPRSLPAAEEEGRRRHRTGPQGRPPAAEAVELPRLGGAAVAPGHHPQGHDAAFRRVHDRVQRASQRIPALLPQASGSGPGLLPGGV